MLRNFALTSRRLALLIAAFTSTALFAVTASAQNTLEILPTATTPGGTATATVALTNDTPVQGFQVAMTYDNTQLTLSGINTDNTDAAGALAAGGGIEFFTTTTDDAIAPGVGWAAGAAIFDFTTPFNSQTLPPGTQQSLINFNFSTPSDMLLVGTATTLTLENGMGSPALFNVVTVAGSSVLPALVDGAIEFIDSPLFKRGDVNGDGIVNLADAISMIQYLFNDGPTPGCIAAASANGDNIADLSDSIYLIIFLFNDGPTPPAPYPNCGAAPPSSTASCNNYNGC